MAGKTTKKTTSVDTKVEAVRRFFADSKPENHPIKEHPVSKQEEYVRDLYLEMLCVMAQYESSNTENAFTLIKRIMAACEETQPLQEYIKHSMEITPERAAEFVKQCKDNGLREIFMVDSMLLSCANGEPNAKQVAFVTEFGDMLGFDREQMKDMSSFTLAILAQDSERYQKLLKDENAAVQESLVGYAKEFVSGLLLHSSSRVYYYSQTLLPVLFEERVEDGVNHGCGFWDHQEVTLENVHITQPLYFRNIEDLKIIGCFISNITLLFDTIRQITIDQCNFEWKKHDGNTYDGSDFKWYYYDRAIKAYLSNASVTIKNTKFTGFEIKGKYEKYDQAYGSVFYNAREDGSSTIIFDHCKFSDIYNTCVERSRNYAIFAYKSGNHSVTVTNCQFTNCMHTNYGRRLFQSVDHEENNTLVHSDPIS